MYTGRMRKKKEKRNDAMEEGWQGGERIKYSL